MYDSPKAVHFVAKRDGVEIPTQRMVSIAMRWRVAHACRNAGVRCMMHLSQSDRITIDEITESTNNNLLGTGVTVELDQRYREVIEQ